MWLKVQSTKSGGQNSIGQKSGEQSFGGQQTDGQKSSVSETQVGKSHPAKNISEVDRNFSITWISVVHYIDINQ